MHSTVTVKVMAAQKADRVSIARLYYFREEQMKVVDSFVRNCDVFVSVSPDWSSKSCVIHVHVVVYHD